MIRWRAETTPHAEGLVGTRSRWTWAGVDTSVRAISTGLIRAGAMPGEHVALYRAKTAESILAVWGIQAAGCVVVPVDAQGAADAVQSVLTTAEVKFAICDQRLVERLPTEVAPLDVEQLLATTPIDTAISRQADDRAYLIFTSGSTGVPKGIVHTNASALAYAQLVVDTYRFTTDDRIAGMSPLHFDMSTLELYAAPLAGSAIVVMDEVLMRFPASFVARSAAEQVTVWYTVPFFLQQVAARGALDQHEQSLRWLLYGGEPYTAAQLRTLCEGLPTDLWVSNVYGPAEVNQCTVWSAPVHAIDPTWDDIPIGGAWAGARVAIVDEHGLPVTNGSQGELLVQATTAMSGYWKLPELTADRFRERPDLGPGRWYSTGDVVWTDSHGVLHYAGRSDHQVKIRGMRFELEGIEAVLATAPGVLHAVAGANADADGVVAAVVTLGQPVNADDVLSWARARLHPTVVPIRLVQYEQFPTTQSGKINRRQVRAELKGTP